MTELETLQRAKAYMDALANGNDPISGEMMEEDTVLNQVRLARCFFFVSNILGEIISNGGVVTKPERRLKIQLSAAELATVTLSEQPVLISDFCKNIDSLFVGKNMRKLPPTKLANWLVDAGFLEIVQDAEGKNRKIPTKQGFQMGITTEERTGSRGTYVLNRYSASAQQFLLDNLLDILET